MVKADPTRNYYADLKVSATASENEIRKAFRTLALQYHPDRNPGREAEVVVKFQEIQAAHEVLCDPAQRAKYDAERRKYRNASIPANTPNTPRARPPPPSRNAYTTTTPSGSYYRAPPPKPQPQQRPPPPQPQHSYSTGADRFTNKNFRPPPTAQKSDARARDAEARANVFTAWQKMKQPRGEEARQHNPNAYSNAYTNPQANPNGTPFGRSQSTRAPPKQGFDPSIPGMDEGQARSAYRNYARAAPTPPRSATPPKESPADNIPYSEGNRVRTPYYSHVGGERTSVFENMGRSASVRNSPTYHHRASSSHDAGAYSDSGRKAQSSKPANKGFAHGYPDSSDEDSDSDGDMINGKNQYDTPPPPPQQSARPPPPTWAQSGFATPDPKRQTYHGAGHMPNSFKSRSEESINMKFSPSDWHGKFEGSSSYFAPDPPKGASTKGRSSPTRGRASQRSTRDRNPFSTQNNPFAQVPLDHIPPPPPGPPPGVNFPPPPVAPHATKFSPQDWQETFKDPNWVYNDTKDTSPRRPSETTKRPKGPRKASVQKNGDSKTQEQSDASRPKYQAFAEEASNGDADAMDIDPGPPSTEAKKGATPGPAAPKLNTAAAGSMPNGFASAPPSATTAKPPAAGLNGLGPDFIKPLVEPQKNGLGGMSSVGDALPFSSEASNSHPIKANAARSLKYPEVPHAPPVPAKLDLASIDQYFERMGSYVKSYRNYCKVLTGHFAARNMEMDDLDDHFVRNRGETTKKLGFVSYLAKMEEDESVMETWKVAQERHIVALQQCADVRTKALKLYQTLQA